jgi:hypothetical protein
VYAPLALITACKRLCIEETKLWHRLSPLSSSHLSFTVATMLALDFGITAFHCLTNTAHKFSMGFRSGEYGSHSINSISGCNRIHSKVSRVYGRGDCPEFNKNIISKLIIKVWKINRKSIPA